MQKCINQCRAVSKHSAPCCRPISLFCFICNSAIGCKWGKLAPILHYHESMMMMMMMMIVIIIIQDWIPYGSTNILSSSVHTFCPADLTLLWLCLVSLELSAQRPSVLSCVSDLWGFCCKFLYKNLNHFVLQFQRFDWLSGWIFELLCLARQEAVANKSPLYVMVHLFKEDSYSSKALWI